MLHPSLYALRPKTMIVMSSFCERPLAWVRTSERRALPISAARAVAVAEELADPFFAVEITLRDSSPR